MSTQPQIPNTTVKTKHEGTLKQHDDVKIKRRKITKRLRRLKQYDDVEIRRPPNKLRLPRLHCDFEELLRLMKRDHGKDIQEGRCLICGQDHSYLHCPYIYEIPPGVEIDCEYDEVCLGCGRIGMRCCSKGAYAYPKRCEACRDYGHWYWEHMCPDGARQLIDVPSIEKVQEEIVKNKDRKKEDEFFIYNDFEEMLDKENI